VRSPRREKGNNRFGARSGNFKLRLVWLRARRIWLELWNAPRMALESPEPDARSFFVAQIVLYVVTAVMLLAGVVRLMQ
jgi:hypothetical protein